MACFHGFCLSGVIKLGKHISQKTGHHPQCLDINPEGSQGSQGRVTVLWVFVCSMLPGQEEEVTCHKAVLLVGEFNYRDLCWRSSTIKHKQSRCFLESTDDEDPTRNGLLFDLIPTQR